jgi:hypothetical protein
MKRRIRRRMREVEEGSFVGREDLPAAMASASIRLA